MQVTNGQKDMSQMTKQELQAEIERLKQLKSEAPREISIKVSQKGAVSVYGLGRFPVTLYKQQWQKLLGISDNIKQFIADNESKLSTKD